MTVEIYPSFLAETSQMAPSSPVTGHWSGRTRRHEPETTSVGDDEDLAFVVSPPPSRWPRIFPSL
jgi:hypothetical protein